MVLANSSVAANASAAATDGQGKRASTFNGAIRSPATSRLHFYLRRFSTLLRPAGEPAQHPRPIRRAVAAIRGRQVSLASVLSHRPRLSVARDASTPPQPQRGTALARPVWRLSCG